MKVSRLADSPLPLALLRIVLPLVIVASPEMYVARGLAASTERQVFLPEGLLLLGRLPLGQDAVRVLQIVALSSAATALLGFFSRVSMLALTVSAGLIFSLSQREGAVLHDMHLFWLTALLAASPCGEAWSLDSWGKARPLPSVRFGVPLTFARLLLGLVYFFPGVHKLRVSGLAWVTAENVIHQMHAKWLEHGAIPVLRVDHAPSLCAAGAAFVVVFELSFVFLALASQKTRWAALVLGLAFHAATQAFFFIPFVSLWACYVVLVDGRLLESMERRLWRPKPVAKPEAVESVEHRVSPAIVVGALCVVLVVVQGVRGATQAWPFACYPTFAHVQSGAIPDVLVELVSGDGTTMRVTGREEGRVRSQAEWGRVFRLSGAYGDVAMAEALRDHARTVAKSAGIAPNVVRIRIYRVDVPTAPEAWGQPPGAPEASATLLTELAGPL